MSDLTSSLSPSSFERLARLESHRDSASSIVHVAITHAIEPVAITSFGYRLRRSKASKVHQEVMRRCRHM